MEITDTARLTWVQRRRPILERGRRAWTVWFDGPRAPDVRPSDRSLRKAIDAAMRLTGHA